MVGSAGERAVWQEVRDMGLLGAHSSVVLARVHWNCSVVRIDVADLTSQNLVRSQKTWPPRPPSPSPCWLSLPLSLSSLMVGKSAFQCSRNFPPAAP